MGTEDQAPAPAEEQGATTEAPPADAGGDAAVPAAEQATEEAPAESAETDEPVALGALFQEEAAWTRALDAIAEKEGIQDKGFAGVKLEDIEDPVARRMVYNLRLLARKASSSLGMEKQRLTTEQAKLDAARQNMAADHAKLMGIFQSDKVKELLDIKDPEQPLDPLSPEGIQHQAKLEAANFLRDVFGAINQADEDVKRQARETLAEQERQAELAELRTFVDAHPDFTEHIEEIKAMRTATGNTIKAIDAYWVLKARRGEFQQSAPESPRATSQRVLGRASAGMAVPEMPAGLSAEQQLQWLEDNPEGAKAFIAKYTRR